MKLTPGESTKFRFGERRVVSFVRGGKLAYLWIGNDDEHNRACFATLSGPDLIKLAKMILREGLRK